MSETEYQIQELDVDDATPTHRLGTSLAREHEEEVERLRAEHEREMSELRRYSCPRSWSCCGALPVTRTSWTTSGGLRSSSGARRRSSAGRGWPAVTSRTSGEGALKTTAL